MAAISKLIKDANCAVTNTELGYVAGVTSAIQTQFTAKANFPRVTTAATTQDDKSNAALAVLSTQVNVAITTTQTNEVVFVFFNGMVQATSGTFPDHLLGFKVDSGPAVLCYSHQELATNSLAETAQFFTPVTIASAGAHTIHLLHGEGDNGGNSRLIAATTNRVGVFGVVQLS